VSIHSELKEIAWKTNRELPAAGLVIHTFGNASVFDKRKGVFAIKPSGVPFSELVAEDMVVVDLASNVVEGELRPSSDTKTHAVLYRAWHDIGAIVHTHSLYASAWAQAMEPIPVLGTTHADYLAQDIPCTDVMNDEMVKGNYEEETGHQILKTFATLSHREVEMVLVACHGPFTWGRNAEKALENSVMLEQIAHMAYLALQINPETPRLKRSLLRKHYERKHGPEAYYGQHDDTPASRKRT
jgi:L-ribulose-5-phosphate 4-epimerase